MYLVRVPVSTPFKKTTLIFSLSQVLRPPETKLLLNELHLLYDIKIFFD